MPVAHETEHGPQADHLDITQFTAHWKVLQFVVEVGAGHATPPYRAGVIMERDLVLEPVPQVFVQEP